MPSSLHELLVELLRSRPALVAELLALTGAQVPAHDEVELSSAEVSDAIPAEYRADNVVVLRSGGTAVYAVVGEVQRSRDDEKPYTWPVYQAGVRRRWRCPTAVLVLCPDSAIAAWANRTIDLDLLGSQICPRVLGPADIPVVLDAAQAAADPELAVLSAVAHGDDPARIQVIDVGVAALSGLDPDRRVTYLGTIFAGLTTALARAHLEDLMNSIVANSELVQMFEARGRAAMVLRILAARGLEVDEDVRARIQGCVDIPQLEAWGDRAVVANSTQDLFD